MRMRLGIISDFGNRLVRRLILLRHFVVGFFLLLPGFTLLALGFLLYTTRLFDFARISVPEMRNDVIDLLVCLLPVIFLGKIPSNQTSCCGSSKKYEKFFHSVLSFSDSACSNLENSSIPVTTASTNPSRSRISMRASTRNSIRRRFQTLL